MHPAEHRGLRELHAAARQLRVHWRELGQRLDAVGHACPQLAEGSDAAAELLSHLTAASTARGLHARPAAQGLGKRIAGARLALVDPALEVNQALRMAVLDATHVATLLAYVGRLAAQRGDDELATILDGWIAPVRVHEDALRAAAIACADDPDAAIAAATPGLAGRAGHAVANVAGTAGEWVDRRLRR